jgi:hypothetical protein
LNFLNHKDIGVRLWTATSLLPIYTEDAIETLEQITKVKGIHSLSAEITLQEWRKGNIKIY